MKYIQEVIAELTSKGYSVETYTRTIKSPAGRKANSLRITRITKNGLDISFAKSGAKGNTYARNLIGAKTSSKILKHVAKNREKISKSKLTKRQQRIIATFNKSQKKLGKGKYGKVVIRKMKKKRGWEGTKKALSNITIHNKGYAYDKNVEILYERLKSATNVNFETFSFSRARAYINSKRHIQDAQLVEIYKILYNWENGQLSNKEAEDYILEVLKR